MQVQKPLTSFRVFSFTHAASRIKHEIVKMHMHCYQEMFIFQSYEVFPGVILEKQNLL